MEPRRAGRFSPPFSRGVVRLSIWLRVGAFFFVPGFDIGFSIGQPAGIVLLGMLAAHDSLLFRDKGGVFGFRGSSTA
jgi:hypothetical protein